MILNLILYLVVGFFIAPIVILWNTIKIGNYSAVLTSLYSLL